MIFERRCPVCAAPHPALCAGCVDRLELAAPASVSGLDAVVALFVYDDVSAQVVLAGKNGGRRDLLRWAGGHLGSIAGPVVQPDVITWVPAHPTQRRARGFDQGQVLARAVSAGFEAPARRLLRRSRGASRKGLDRQARLVGPRLRSRSTRGTVLVVDDVMATGASLSRAAHALRSAGASTVVGAVVAASPGSFTDRRARRQQTIYSGPSSGMSPQST